MIRKEWDLRVPLSFLTQGCKKHGKEKHLKEILEFLPSRSELKKRERELVNEEILDDVLCMNLKLGGEGGWDHITTEQKRRGGLRGGSIVGSKFGKINVKNLHTPEVIEKAVATRKANGTFVGRPQPHSDETRLKMSINRMGEKNNQYGTCWITDGGQTLKIKVDALDSFLKRGFRRGRK